MRNPRKKAKLEDTTKKNSGLDEAVKALVKMQTNTDKKLKELSDFCLSEKKRGR